MSEHELKNSIAAAAAGDQMAFRELFLMLEPQLFAFVRYRVVDESTAAEVVQDTLVAFFQALPTFAFLSSGQLYQYIYTIARRQLAKHYKAEKGEVRLDEEAEARFVAPLVDPALPLDVVNALAKLDAVSRDIIVLHHWARHTFAEIGTILSLSEGAVRTRHHRAKEQLANLLI